MLRDFVGGFLLLDGGTIFMFAVGWGLIASSASTTLWLALYYEDSYPTCTGDDKSVFAYSYQSQQIGSAFYATYLFFPTFLLAGYMSYVALRWREFMVNCHTIQAKIHNVALMCGMSLKERPVSMDARKRLYTIYRYLSMIHALTYQTVSDSLRQLSLQPQQRVPEVDDQEVVGSGDFCRLGLLTPREVRVLLPMDNKIRDTLMTWLGAEVIQLMRQHAHQYAPDITTDLICQLRGVCGRHHDLFVRDNPNTYVRLLIVVVMLWLTTFVVTSPWRMTIYAGGGKGLGLGAPCFQPYVLLANILVILTIASCVSLIRLLRNPFALTVERIKVDNLLASTDRTIFASLRGLFDDTTTGQDDDNYNYINTTTIAGDTTNSDHEDMNSSSRVFVVADEEQPIIINHPRPSIMRTGARSRKAITRYTNLGDLREI